MHGARQGPLRRAHQRTRGQHVAVAHALDSPVPHLFGLGIGERLQLAGSGGIDRVALARVVPRHRRDRGERGHHQRRQQEPVPRAAAGPESAQGHWCADQREMPREK